MESARLPAAANAGLVQLTTITGIYGLSFLVAGFNALLAWTAAADAPTLKRRVAISAAVAAILIAAEILGLRNAPVVGSTSLRARSATQFSRIASVSRRLVSIARRRS